MLARQAGRVFDGAMGQEEYGDYSVDDEDQLQPGDSLDDRGVADVLDEGIVTREGWSPAQGFGNTLAEQRVGASLDRQLGWEVPEDTSDEWNDEWQGEDDLADEQVGDQRSGRLVAASDDDDRFVSDVGIDGAGSSAEEAAMHVIDESDL